MPHYPVMTREVIEHLAVRPDGVYLDATAGLGGHTEAIARLLRTGKVIANDRDPQSLAMARERLAPWGDRVVFLHGRFSELESGLARLGVGPLHGLVADLGVSRYQLTDAERGFSFGSEAPLDMRMDRNQPLRAADLINHLAEKQLARLIYDLGEERRHSRRIARAIVRARPLNSTRQLAKVIEAVVPRRGRLHPATRTFMALRLAVNEELDELDRLLDLLPRLLAPAGRAVFLTFHSLEDRRVKLYFRNLARAGRAVVLTKHVIRPSEEEIRGNPPSRSAKLRALEMKGTSRQERTDGDAGDIG